MVKVKGTQPPVQNHREAVGITSQEQLGIELLGNDWKTRIEQISDQDPHFPEKLVLAVIGEAVNLHQEVKALQEAGANNTEPSNWSSRFSLFYRFGNQGVTRSGRPMMSGLHLAKIMHTMLENGELLAEGAFISDLKSCTIQEFKHKRGVTPLKALAKPILGARQHDLLKMLGIG